MVASIEGSLGDLEEALELLRGSYGVRASFRAPGEGGERIWADHLPPMLAGR
jgi:hypothetical protein